MGLDIVYPELRRTHTGACHHEYTVAIFEQPGLLLLGDGFLVEERHIALTGRQTTQEEKVKGALVRQVLCPRRDIDRYIHELHHSLLQVV